MAQPEIIYYAHPMSWYNTKDEQLDLSALSQLGSVANPNSEAFERQVEYAQRKQRPVMDVFANYIQNIADGVAFRRLNDGRITAGVAREVFEAIIWGKKVYEITTDANGVRWVSQLVNPALTLGNIATVAETKAALAEGTL